ncbi:WLM domain-containing protein [Rhodocollybia butyracea]|uniref:WLM domain-containing protein n=1 Tax=Rhodocollybia butyracea TaxID=206335 RepID=A0A9P5U7Q2_9AGAR|nr:WLM domain-containing protein [Rhodocollybia butyracea]
MVHSRYNEQENNPNPHINFITPVAKDSEDARQLLRALAAQVRPVMKSHGFTVNSFEEYEHNAVFAGRNWNNGETIELVLRRPGGSFLPSSWLMSTLCHELAHIKHMNHGPSFQALWQKLRNEVRKLQDKGYYGDGMCYWSAGTRLADSAVVPGQGLDIGDLPEYICGGAQSRTRPAHLRQRRGPRRPSNSTGRQTAKQRKAGSRVTSKYAFRGEGVSISSDATAAGKGFGKQAGRHVRHLYLKRAREERALAAERRLQSLASSSITPAILPPEANSEVEDDGELEDAGLIPETDSDRRKALLATQHDEDLDNLHSGKSWRGFEDDFVFTGQGRSDVIDISSDEESTGADAKGKRKASTIENFADSEPSSKKTRDSGSKLGLGKIVETEVAFRKKEALGMTPVQGKGRRVGGSSKHSGRDGEHLPWPCSVCTLENKPLHLACAVCGTKKGQQLFKG